MATIPHSTSFSNRFYAETNKILTWTDPTISINYLFCTLLWFDKLKGVSEWYGRQSNHQAESLEKFRWNLQIKANLPPTPILSPWQGRFMKRTQQTSTLYRTKFISQTGSQCSPKHREHANYNLESLPTDLAEITQKAVIIVPPLLPRKHWMPGHAALLWFKSKHSHLQSVACVASLKGRGC